jgi:hypothetical protein
LYDRRFLIFLNDTEIVRRALSAPQKTNVAMMTRQMLEAAVAMDIDGKSWKFAPKRNG